MTPYRPGSSKFYKLRVTLADGRSRICSCGTDLKPVAMDIERFYRTIRSSRRWDVLTPIVEKRASLADAYDHRTDIDAWVAKVGDVDVEPYVIHWHASKAKSRKGAASADKYHTHVRQLVKAGKRFNRSAFTAARIRAHLRALKVEDPTRNRHKAAFSSFAEYLVDEGVLERNPVRDVKGWSEGEGRLVYYEREQAQAIIKRLSAMNAAAEALMVGAGFEWQAVERVRVRDIDLKAGTAFAHGGKTPWRKRLCRIVEAWCVEYVRSAVAGKLPDALVFDGLTEKAALLEHKAACKAAKLPESTNHDWRHTHAVLMLRSGYKPTVVAHQLGHRDTSLVWKRYGRFVVDDRDYVLPGTLPDVKENVK
jgi:integrase